MNQGCPIEIEVVRETLLSEQICTTIPPERCSEINDALRATGKVMSGTTGGWRLDETIEPVPCKLHKNRWHYILVC